MTMKVAGVSCVHRFQAVDDTAFLGGRLLREARPGAARQFADIDVALAVHGDAVRRGELARQDTAARLAELRQSFTPERMDADARPDIRPAPVDLARGPALADRSEERRVGK